jgi:hypothetical protein
MKPEEERDDGAEMPRADAPQMEVADPIACRLQDVADPDLPDAGG